MSMPTIRRVFAIVVGIDQYLHHTPSQGGVDSARLFQEFVLTTLGPSLSDLVFLWNQSATRDSILSTFRTHFIKNGNVQRGDAMIFFFSGAGYLVQAAGDISTGDQQVQHISPWDEGGEYQGRYIHCLPFYVLEWMLRELAVEKGNNITVILDVISRKSSPRSPIPVDLDRDLRSEQLVVLPHTEWSRVTLGSHVLLARCSPEQGAHVAPSIGNAGVGVFTKALVDSLRRLGISTTTYTELIDDIMTAMLDAISQKSNSKSPIPLDLDGDLRSQQLVAPQTERSRVTLGSHVLLARCSPEQGAHVAPSVGNAGVGVFTKALVDSLRRSGLSTTTYIEVIDRLLPLFINQTPYCRGINKDLPVFQIPVDKIE